MVDTEQLDAQALGTALRIAALAPGAARLNKQILRALQKNMLLAPDQQAQAASDLIANNALADPYAYADSAEHREGINAFLAKRAPVF